MALRRAERLFRIIQVLRRETRRVRAADLAAELEVSYRIRMIEAVGWRPW